MSCSVSKKISKYWMLSTRNCNHRFGTCLTMDDLIDGENISIKVVQQEFFHYKLNLLK